MKCLPEYAYRFVDESGGQFSDGQERITGHKGGIPGLTLDMYLDIDLQLSSYQVIPWAAELQPSSRLISYKQERIHCAETWRVTLIHRWQERIEHMNVHKFYCQLFKTWFKMNQFQKSS